MAKANKSGSSKDGKQAKDAKPKAAKGGKAKASKSGKAAKDAKPNIFARFIQYLRDVWAELKRVVWPGRTEVLNSSVVVIVTVVFFVIFTFVIDSISVQFVELIARIGG